MNQSNFSDSGLGQYMHKATPPLGGVESSNLRRWRGEWLHHHGGDDCYVFVLLWTDSWIHEHIVCKKWYKNNLKMRLTTLLSAPHWHAPYQKNNGWRGTLAIFLFWKKWLETCLTDPLYLAYNISITLLVAFQVLTGS